MNTFKPFPELKIDATEWNFDISEAPLGRTVVIGKFAQFAPDWIWVATKCGKVIKTHWKPKDAFGGERFVGLNKGEQPVAWQHFVIPVHPHASKAVSEDERARRSKALDELGELDGELSARIEAAIEGETA